MHLSSIITIAMFESIRRHSWQLYDWLLNHDDVIKWKHFWRYWPFRRGIHRSPVNYPHKGHWRVALMFSFICARLNGWVNNREAGGLRRHRVHYDVTVMCSRCMKSSTPVTDLPNDHAGTGIEYNFVFTDDSILCHDFKCCKHIAVKPLK